MSCCYSFSYCFVIKVKLYGNHFISNFEKKTLLTCILSLLTQIKLCPHLLSVYCLPVIYISLDTFMLIIQVGLNISVPFRIGGNKSRNRNCSGCKGLWGPNLHPPGGGGGHCLFEGRYPLPNYRPCLSALFGPQSFFTAP